MTRQQTLALEADGRAAAIAHVHAATAIYTAAPVVELLLSRLGWPARGLRLCDPSCGDGSFLVGALKAFLRVEPQASAADLVNAIEGWEFHPGAAASARQRVRGALCEFGWSLSAAVDVASRIVREADFLTDGPREPRYHIVAGNPPYLRRVNVPAELQAIYQGIAPSYALPDLAYTFLDRCADVLHAGGVCGMVTADRWLFNAGAAELRRQLGTRMSVIDLQRLDADSAFYRPKVRRAGTPPRVHPVAVVLAKGGGAGRYALDGSAIYPDAGDMPAGARLLSEIATLRLAPWLGTDGVFTVSAEVADRLPAGSFVPAADASDFVDGTLRIRRYALVTQPDEMPCEAVLAHLRRSAASMCDRGRNARFWLPPERWVGRFDLSEPCLLVPRIAKGLRPVVLPAGVLPINHGVTVATSSIHSLADLRAILESEDSQQWVRARAARLENGYLSITTRLLRQLPVRRR